MPSRTAAATGVKENSTASSVGALVSGVASMGDDDEDVFQDILAWFVCLTDPLIPEGERRRRHQVAHHHVNQNRERSLLLVSWILVGLFEKLPADDGFKAPGNATFDFLDIDLNMEGNEPLIHIMKTGDINLEQDGLRLLSLASLGWGPVLSAIELTPSAVRFEGVSSAIRNLLRRNNCYSGVDFRFFKFIAYVGTATQPNEARLLQHISPLRIPTGLYPAISVAIPEPPF